MGRPRKSTGIAVARARRPMRLRCVSIMLGWLVGSLDYRLLDLLWSIDESMEVWRGAARARIYMGQTKR